MVHLLGRSQHCKQPKGRLDQTLAGFTHAPRCSQAFYLFSLQFVPVFNRSFFEHVLMMLSFVVKVYLELQHDQLQKPILAKPTAVSSTSSFTTACDDNKMSCLLHLLHLQYDVCLVTEHSHAQGYNHHKVILAALPATHEKSSR